MCVHTAGHLEASAHWSRWRALLILIVATVLMSACADLTTEHIQPILSHSSISQVDNAVNQSCRSILKYFCMYDLTLLFISVFHRCDSFGHDPWNPRNRQRSAVCSSEYNQFEVGLSVTLWASGHNNGQWFLSHLFNHRFISSGVFYWNTRILSFFHSFEVGRCIAVQVCMIQIPILVLFNIFFVSCFGYAFLMQTYYRYSVTAVFMCLPYNLSVTGCWLCTHLQRPAPVGQHL